jgi:hypothetical protein
MPPVGFRCFGSGGQCEGVRIRELGSGCGLMVRYDV